MSNTKGVTYYKLESKYAGDTTKYCGLTGIEIDNNFNFLRGYDISNICWDPEKETLTFKRINGNEIIVDNIKKENIINYIKDNKDDFFDFSVDGSYFDNDTKTFHLFINGKDYPIENFDSSNVVFSDDTLNGNGLNKNPLTVSKTLLSGNHLPAIKLVNEISGETLPNIIEKDDVYLTLENVSGYGLLYNYDGVEEIAKILKKENSKWRVPSSQEWGEMLNYLESCDDRNHNSEITGEELGNVAGLYIKSKDSEWTFDDDTLDVVKSYNFEALPTGYGTKNQKNHEFGNMTCFWTSDMHNDLDKVYCRRLEDNEDGVIKSVEELFYYYSLRLVRDLTDTSNKYENINGIYYPTVQMPYIDEDGNEGTKVWTSVNVTFNDLLSGETPMAINVIDNSTGNIPESKATYFINIWNGVEWEKRELLEDETIVLKTGPDSSKDEEWILIDGVLVKRSDIMLDKVENTFIKPLKNELNIEIENRINDVNSIKNTIEEKEASIKDLINNETNNRIDDSTEIKKLIEDERNERIIEDSAITDNILELNEKVTNLEKNSSTSRKVAGLTREILRINEEISGITTEIDDLQYALVDLSENTYTKSEIDNIIGGVWHFKGTLDNVNSLNAISDMTNGDVYQIGEKEYAYNGDTWVELGFNPITDIPEIIDASGNTILNGGTIQDAFRELIGMFNNLKNNIITDIVPLDDDIVITMSGTTAYIGIKGISN